MLYDGCCGVVDEEKGDKFFALSFYDYRVYLTDTKVGAKVIAEELDDFMGLHESNMINATDDAFTWEVLNSLADFQKKEIK